MKNTNHYLQRKKDNSLCVTSQKTLFSHDTIQRQKTPILPIYILYVFNNACKKRNKFKGICEKC